MDTVTRAAEWYNDQIKADAQSWADKRSQFVTMMVAALTLELTYFEQRSVIDRLSGNLSNCATVWHPVNSQDTVYEMQLGVSGAGSIAHRRYRYKNTQEWFDGIPIGYSIDNLHVDKRNN